MADLWVEKYRPDSLDGYVFKNENVKDQVNAWIEAGEVPGHMLFSGTQGTGKTTLALLLLKELFFVHLSYLLKKGFSQYQFLD